MSLSNVSYDLIWQVTRANSNYLVKRTDAGGVRFSADPLNATGVYDQKHASFANSHAYSAVSTPEGIKIVSKDNKNWNKPNKTVQETAIDASHSQNEDLEAATRKAAALAAAQASAQA